MKIKTRAKRNATGIFTFDANDLQALERVVDICLDIRESLANMNSTQITSDSTGEDITAWEICNIAGTLEVLMGNNKHSWTFTDEE